MRTFNQSITSSVIIDTGILLEYINGTSAGKTIEEMIFSNDYIAAIHVTSLTLIEIYYLIRRKKSRKETRKIVNKLKRILVVVPIHDYIDHVGEIKSQVAISLVDCCTIGFAEWNQCSAIFKHENEIDSQLQGFQEKIFLQRLVFIEDFPIYGILTAKYQKNYSKQNGEE